MRIPLGFLAGLGFILTATACSSSSGGGSTTGSSGGTTGVSTSGGSTGTGGTSGGSSTGGTAADAGGNLAAGAPCTSNGQCISTVCGANGSGNCCSHACSTTDATCGATACDGTGACTYPITGTHCGTDSCTTATLTQSACDGAGVCAAGTPAPCPGDLQCKDATSCDTQCSASTDCVTGFYCDTTSNHCLPKHSNGACTTNEACISGVCGVAGSGNCCTAACAAATDPACDPTSCDATSGACIFPTGAACGTATCTGSTLTAGTCTATGSCNVGSGPCPNNFVCASSGMACLATCTAITDCVTGHYCSATKCLPQIATGACTTNDACTSGICGVAGAGHCCTAACSTSDATCGARDCDNAGACSYPNNKTSCGAAESCTGSTQTDPTSCDGAGTCQKAGTTDCTPYICGATACLASCKDNTSCVSGDFCDIANTACCSGLTKGGSIAVDGTNGSDATACCGIGTNGACQTLTHAMVLIDAAQAQNVTINATVKGGGGDWTAKETYPVKLGWGVELSAPGVFFLDPVGAMGQFHAETFLVTSYSANDKVGYASVVGTAKSTVGVGMDSSGTQTDDSSTIAIDAKNTLYIANASVNGSVSVNNFTDSNEAILVSAGAGLTLGQDQSAGVTGTVTIGNSLGQGATDGWQGIVCKSDGKSLGCTIQDAALVGQNSVVIQGQEFQDIDAEDFASISLTSSPVIGVPPSAVGFGNCPQKFDAISSNNNNVELQAVRLNGKVTFTFKNGIVQCIGGRGFLLQASPNGNPTATIDSTTIQNTDLGILATAGTATVTNTSINNNFNGAQQDTDGVNNGTIDFSGGGNTVICSSNTESSQATTKPGIDVYNTSTANLNATNVTWDTLDTNSPDYFDCDAAFTSCTCNLSSCTTAAGSDDMDAVEDSTNVGGITTTGAALSANACN